MLPQLLSLPEEVQFDILLRLDVKHLMICACVSKTLYNFITHPEFINAHYKKHKDNPLILLGYHRSYSNSRDKYFGFYLGNESSFEENSDVKLIEVPKDTRIDDCFGIIGCFNGVICLYDDRKEKNYSIMLWNPTIKKSIQLPQPSVIPSLGFTRAYLGFGCDRVTNELKVVRLVYNYIDLQAYPSELPPIVEVYTVGSMSWRRIQGSGPMHKIFGRKPDAFPQGPYAHCFFNGISHWVGYKERIPKGVWSAIVTFDMHDECFNEIKLPSCVEGRNTWPDILMLTHCWDMLALIIAPRENGEYCIWVMKEYGKVESWNKLYTFDRSYRYCPRPKAVYFRKNKEILMLASEPFEGITIFSVEYDKDVKKKLGYFKGRMKGTFLGAYEEGLALFKEGNSYIK